MAAQPTAGYVANMNSSLLAVVLHILFGGDGFYLYGTVLGGSEASQALTTVEIARPPLEIVV